MQMISDYNLVKSLTREEFDERRSKAKPVRYNQADDEEIKKMERLLDVLPGTLAGGKPYSLEKRDCTFCERTLTMYDFIFTALVDANHTKSLVLHTLVGNKLIIQTPRPVRCSACGTINPDCSYEMPKSYSCSQKL